MSLSRFRLIDLSPSTMQTREGEVCQMVDTEGSVLAHVRAHYMYVRYYLCILDINTHGNIISRKRIKKVFLFALIIF